MEDGGGGEREEQIGRVFVFADISPPHPPKKKKNILTIGAPFPSTEKEKKKG